eukprot:Pgem_evm2s7578
MEKGHVPTRDDIVQKSGSISNEPFVCNPHFKMDNEDFQMDGVMHQSISKTAEVIAREQALAEINSWVTDDLYPVPTYDVDNLSSYVIRAKKVDKYEALQAVVKTLNRACTVLQDAKNTDNATAKEKDDFYHRANNAKTKLQFT